MGLPSASKEDCVRLRVCLPAENLVRRFLLRWRRIGIQLSEISCQEPQTASHTNDPPIARTKAHRENLEDMAERSHKRAIHRFDGLMYWGDEISPFERAISFLCHFSVDFLL